jgi:hypothetical protein
MYDHPEAGSLSSGKKKKPVVRTEFRLRVGKSGKEVASLRLALGPTQTHTKGVSGIIFLGVNRPGRAADH